MPRLAWTTRNCPIHQKMAGAKIACILENKDSRSTKGFILRLTFYLSICNIVYIVKIFKWMSNKCVFIFWLCAAQMCLNYAQTNIACSNFRYNISFTDPSFRRLVKIFPSVMISPLGFALGNIITSGNISPNLPHSRSINGKKQAQTAWIRISSVVRIDNNNTIKTNPLQTSSWLQYTLNLPFSILFLSFF